MQLNHTVKTLVGGTLLTGLLGFSSAGLAQSNAIHSLDTYSAQTGPSTARVTHRAEANQLASWLDEYNNQGIPHGGPGTRMPASQGPQHASVAARQLGGFVEAYNSPHMAGSGLVPKSRTAIAREDTPATPAANELAADLTTYNRSGGD